MTYTDANDYVSARMSDPAFRAEYERQSLEDAVDRVISELKSARKSSGITQRALAERLGVGPSSVAKIESKPADSGLELVIRYARALGYEVKIERLGQPTHSQ